MFFLFSRLKKEIFAEIILLFKNKMIAHLKTNSKFFYISLLSQNSVVIPPRIFFANAKDTLSGGWRNLGQSHWGPFFAKGLFPQSMK